MLSRRSVLLVQTAEPNHEPCEVTYTNAQNFERAKEQASSRAVPHVVGIYDLQADSTWQPLPSLQPNERMTHLLLSPSEADIEVRYSKRDNQYYLRSKSQQKINLQLQYILELPTPPVQPRVIAELTQTYLKFSAEALELPNEPLKGEDYLQAIKTQQKGSCRHRAVAFKNDMDNLGYPALIIVNEAHAFGEVFIDNQWITCDLGGYPATLDIDEANEPNTTNKAAILEEVLEPQDPLLIDQQDSVLPSVLAKEPRAIDYRSLFAPWEKTQPKPLPLKRYYQQLLHPEGIKNRLIEVGSDNQLQGLKAGFYNYCHLSSVPARPVFFIQSPDDLVCSAPFMRILPNEKNGEVVKGPGGPLYDFLKRSTPENPPLIVVDYSKFDANDMVRFNSLLDAQRKADGIDVPQEVTIIGVMNNAIVNPQGSDFYSRFDKHEYCPFGEVKLAEQLPPLLLQKAPQLPQEASYINLFHASDWKERLLGRWVLQGQTLSWEEGLLAAALAEDKPIVIENGLNDDPDFKQFWEVAALTRRFPHPINPLVFPEEKSFIFYEKEGYDWDAFIEQVTWDNSFHQEGIMLNPSTLSQLFQRYKTQDKELQTLEGLLAEHAKTKPSEPLHLNLSRALSSDEWAECLAKAKELGLKLSIHLLDDIKLPQALQERLTITKNAKPLFLNKDMLLHSSDIDSSVASLARDLPEVDIFDVSECESSDLLTRLSGRFDEPTLRFEFEQGDKAVINALEEGRSVILKGQISPELADNLLAFVLKRQFAEEAPSGQLFIVTDDASAFPQELWQRDEVLVREKIEHLAVRDKELDQAKLTPILETASLAELKTRLAYYRRHQNPETDNAWQGMDHLEVPKLADFRPETSREEAEAFKAERRNAVHQVLETEPYVFLTGLTGVGKSTFMADEFGSSKHYYQGESKFKAWAKDDAQTLKILFLDEANLSKRQWSECEGLFNDPPTILIDGEKVPLDKYHKLVFAGNPFSYADERIRAAFFKRHGNAVLFQPLPLALIYEDVLSPIFDKPPLHEIRAELVAPILKIYQFITECSTDDVRISPRELQMMALLTLSHCERHPKAKPQDVAYFYAHQIARPLVPAAHLRRFDDAMPAPLPLERQAASDLASFLITPSRQALTQQLNDLLALNRYRRENAATNVQRYGGLGGIILEGEPGIGKSELVTQILVANGYKERHDLSEDTLDELAFLRLPASLSVTEKEAYLTYAFKNGLVVIADEINSSPTMERLLNCLLMGSTLTGERPRKPGFMVIGTQNPITMPGRLAPSAALARRLLTVELPAYTNAEMQDILIKKGFEEQEASHLVNAYEKQLNFGKKHFLSPLPCFRDLLKVAKAILAAKSKVQLPHMPKASDHEDQKTVVQVPAPVSKSVPAPAPAPAPVRVPEPVPVPQEPVPAPVRVPGASSRTRSSSSRARSKTRPVPVPVRTTRAKTNNDENDETIKNFNSKRSQFIQRLDNYKSSSKKQNHIFTKGHSLIKNIDKITKKKPENLKVAKLKELTNILSAADNYLQEPSNKSYKKELARCSAEAYGNESPAWRALGISLMLFGAAVLVFIGVLAAIPTTGASLASALGIVGLVVAGGAISTGVGAFSFFHGREKGMAKDLNQLQKAEEEQSKFIKK